MNKKILSEMRTRDCLVCSRSPTDVCHIKTKKTGGTMDDWNLLSLCREHHAQQHRIGWMGFFTMYPKVEKHVKSLGWEIDETHGRFRFIRSD